MKAILISIKPQHLINILNGNKTIEIRKNKALARAIENLIQEEGYATIYVYCSKEKPYLGKVNSGVDCYDEIIYKYALDSGEKIKNNGNKLWYGEAILRNVNGTVACCFKCCKVEEIKYLGDFDWFYTDLLKKSCLNIVEFRNYLFVDTKKLGGYAIQISDLKIFDEPKYLCDFWNTKKGVFCCPLTKAPQNMVYVEIPTYN